MNRIQGRSGLRSSSDGIAQGVKDYVENKNEDINKSDAYGCTPLYYASLCGHANVVSYLLAHGAQFDMRTFDGQRCYLGALTNQIREILQLHHNLWNKRVASDSGSKKEPESFWKSLYNEKLWYQLDQIISGAYGVINLKDYRGFAAIDYVHFSGNAKAIELLRGKAYPTLRTDFLKLMDDEDGTHDIIFTVEGRQIKAHSIVLLCRCKKFMKQFFNNATGAQFWIQRSSFYSLKKRPIVNIQLPPDVKYRVFLDLMKFYYCEYSYYEEESIAGGFAALMETLKDVQDVQTSFEPPGVDYERHVPQTHKVHVWLPWNMRKAINNPLCSDIIFVLQGNPVFAHKSILFSRSSYFRALLTGGLRESTSNVVSIDDISHITWMHLMEYLYTDTVFHLQTPAKQKAKKDPVEIEMEQEHALWEYQRTTNDNWYATMIENLQEKLLERKLKVPSLLELSAEVVYKNIGIYEVDSENIQDLVTQALKKTSAYKTRSLMLFTELPQPTIISMAIELFQLAEEYFLPGLRDMCEEYLVQNYKPEIEEAIQLYQLAQQYNAVNLRKVCINALIMKYGYALRTPSWKQLPDPVKSEIADAASKRPPEIISAEARAIAEEERRIEKIEREKRRREEQAERQRLLREARQQQEALKASQKEEQETFVEEFVFENNKNKKGGKNSKKKGKK